MGFAPKRTAKCSPRRARLSSTTRLSYDVLRSPFFFAQRFKHEERTGHRRERDVMMPAWPRAPFDVIEAECVFQFAGVLFDAPAAFGEADGAPEPERFSGQLGEPIRDRCGLVAWPLDPQLHRGAGPWAATTDPMRGPEGRQREARAERAPPPGSTNRDRRSARSAS